MIKVEKYLKETLFPNRDIDPKLKDEQYHKGFGEAIYSLWLNNKTAWGYGHQSFFKDMRLLASGNQDPNQYKSFLTGVSVKDQETAGVFDDSPLSKKAKREGWYNLLWQNLSPAAKIMNSIHGMLDKFDFDIFADTIDSESRGMVEFLKYKKFFEAREAKFITEFKQKAGIPVDEDVSFPKTKEELEAFEAREGFKLNVAKSMQKLLRQFFAAGKWNSVIRKKVLDDLVTSGYGCAADVYDSEDKQFKPMYLDPARTVIQHSEEYDYCDSEYGGYFSLWTISNIRRKRPDIDEDRLRAMAKAYIGKCGNPELVNDFDDRASRLDPASNSYIYDDWKVPVFWAVWIDTDTDRRLKYKGSNGRDVIKNIPYDKEIKSLTENQLSRGMKQEISKVPIRLVRQVYWVIDTDICWDAGKMNMAARPKDNKPVLPIHVEQLLQPSLMYRLKPILDSIAITWLTHQNSVAKMVERGYAIDMSMVMGITIGGKKLDPSEVLTMWKQTGFLPYMYNHTGRYAGGAATPVTPIQGGLGERMQETAMSLDMNFKLIEETVGINPMTLGASPDPKAPVATSQAAMQATSNILNPITDALFEMKESMSASAMCRLQIGLRVDEGIRKSYSGVVPPKDIASLVLSENKGVKYGITLRARPAAAQVQELKGYVMAAIERQELPLAEALYFSERLAAGEDLIEIRQQIAYSMEKERQRKFEEQQANIQKQNEGLSQIEQQKAQNQQALIMAEAEADANKEMVKGQVKDNLLKAEENYALMNKLYDLSAQEQGLTVKRER